MMPNLGDREGSVAPGDTVVTLEGYQVVTRVVVHPTPPTGAPIVATMKAVEIQTTGATRWLGGTDAYIGSDLRVHWRR